MYVLDQLLSCRLFLLMILYRCYAWGGSGKRWGHAIEDMQDTAYQLQTSPLRGTGTLPPIYGSLSKINMELHEWRGLSVTQTLL